jgi:hypothetical protein
LDGDSRQSGSNRSPAPYFLAKFNGEVNGQRQEFFTVILVSGTVIQPTQLVAAQ